ncbi:T9SS type A sorting domain-containing protein [Catalinimonas niigatensis]|uniref:T9SS type A sorting domain-containing protein n=1 Tax=Catalinimonas niigatensis TaxID=1397264 RepID=UPI002666443C|nr:T9SS type A sorting domain-containing protein [Catalinimonas niigatensis]WPP52879.1 T9SS type A sorting domain-containing protein [Catalinimonas niigatensis]
MLLQSDGKIILEGDIESYGYVKTSNIIRLNTDGSMDAAYRLPYYKEPFMRMKIDSRDRLYLEEYSDDGYSRRLIRMLSNGSRDEEFQIDQSLGYINQFVVQGDKCIAFVDVWNNGVHEISLIRLDDSGKVDGSFSKYSKKDHNIHPVVQSDGKILVYGAAYITDENGIYHDKPFMARLNENGTIDETFQLKGELKGDYPNIQQVVPQKDGKYIVHGYFDFYDNTPAPGLLRLNADGSLDHSFILPGPTANAFQSISSIYQLPSGKYIAVGYDYEYEKGSFRRLIWLNEDGSLNHTLKTHEFYAYSFQSGELYNIISQGEKILISGGFNRVDDTYVKGIVALDAQGEIITAFAPDLGGKPYISKTIQSKDGGLILAGNFTEINGVEANNIAKLSLSGKADPIFSEHIGKGPSHEVYSLAEQEDGKILVGGGFREFNGQLKSGIVRLHEDGSLDMNFDRNNFLTNLYPNIYAIAIIDNNNIFLGGSINSYNSNIQDLVKIDSVGAIHTSFQPELDARDFFIYDLAVSEKHIIVGGSSYDSLGYTIGRIEKINLDGTADSTFFAKNSVKPNGINSLLLEKNEMIIAGGNHVYGHGDGDTNPLIQINVEKQFIDMYSVGVNGFSTIREILPAFDTTYILAGQFNKINRVSRKGLAMFDLKGRVYNDFRFDLNGEARGAIREDEEHVLVYGSFSQINGFPGFSGIARINITTPRPPSDLLVSVDKALGIQLQWLDSSDYETGFRIYRQSGENEEYVLIDSVAANVTTYWDQDVDPASTYAYKVLSTGNALASDFSNTARVTTSEINLPTVPVGLSASLNSGSIYLAWEDKSDNEIGFIVERAAGDTFVPIDTVYSNSYTDVQGDLQTEYRYQIKAYNVAGESAYSEKAIYAPQLVTAIGEEIEADERAFPNPSSGIFIVKVETKSLQTSDVSLYSTQGKDMKGFGIEIGNQSIRVDLSAYQEGVYFLKVRTKYSAESKVFRLIRRN